MASGAPEPLVVQRMREFKAALLGREATQMQEMARRWLEVEQALAAQLAAVTERLAAQRAERQAATPAQLWRDERFRALAVQAQEQFERYAGWADGEITRQQAALAGLGVQHAGQAVQLTYWQGGTMGAYFNRLPVGAVEALAGLAGDGQPIGTLLRLRMVRDAAGNPLPGVLERLTRSLLEGTALGRNPRDTARRMRDDLAGGLQKALVIARTEQLRVYRLAGVEAYRASGVVVGMKRLTAHDSAVCAGCLADEGTLYPLDAPLSDHPNGRCTGVPVVSGMPETNWLGGEAWFRRQPETLQQAILGLETWDAWRSGAFEFTALTTHTRHAVWGGGIAVTPLRQLIDS